MNSNVNFILLTGNSIILTVISAHVICQVGIKTIEQEGFNDKKYNNQELLTGRL